MKYIINMATNIYANHVNAFEVECNGGQLFTKELYAGTTTSNTTYSQPATNHQAF